MPPLAEIAPDHLSGADDEEEDSDDDGFDEDMEALRRACMLTGTSPDDLKNRIDHSNDGDAQHSSDSDSDGDEDLELLRRVRSRFSNSTEAPPLTPPSNSLPPDDSDDDGEDDYQTLLAVRKRFSAYENDTLGKYTEKIDSPGKPVKKISNEILANTIDAHEIDNAKEQPCAAVGWDESDSFRESVERDKGSSFPKSAQVFMDAIKKNRANQKFLRSKLIEIEAKIEENEKLKERVKIIKGFQVTCKKRTGEALSQKKDPNVQLIAVAKPRVSSKGSKTHEKKAKAMFYGPEENSHVANYKMTMTTFLHSLDRKKWSKEEKKALEKGIRQQFQEMVLQFSVDESSYAERSNGDSDHIDDILASIKDLQITPENIREFLPKVNWEQLASMYLVGRTSGECESRWLNWEDPLINHGSWTAKEDKNLLYLVQKKGIDDWFDISVSLGTNRTPFQCLARYQRSLNASILKREWTKDEDEQLRSAVEAFGECDWQSVASVLGGRTGTQCSNRWKKTLHPTKQREGRWSPDEDKRLKVAQMLFGPRNWNKTAQFVPGRTQAQCRDRYVNALEPSLNWGTWTKEDDSRLRGAIAKHGYCWSKVAECVPRRTDNMCWRRWQKLSPDEVSLLRESKIIKRAALMCNFVDRETERPAIGPNDFLPPIDTSTKTITYPRKRNGNLRRVLKSGKKKNVSSCKVPKKIRPRRERKNNQSLVEVPEMVNCYEVETCDRHDASIEKKKVRKLQPRRRKGTEPTEECQVIVTVPPENDTQEPAMEMSSSDQIAGALDGDDTTLACFIQTKSTAMEVPGMVNCDEFETCDRHDASIQKNKVREPQLRRRKCTEPTEEQEEPREMSCLDQFAAASDDDTTLACFIQTISKKRKLGPSDPSINKKKRKLLAKPTLIACDNQHGIVKSVRGQKIAIQEPERKVVGVNLESEKDVDDVFLSSLAKNNLKKRHPVGTCWQTAREVGTVDVGKLQQEVDHCEPVRRITWKIGAEDDDAADNMTLASFLRKKSKKRRCQSSKCS